MKIGLLLIAAASLVLTACDRPHDKTKDTNPPKTNGTSERNTLPQPDNTERNTRDRNFSTKTSGDQGESELDRTLSQTIRSALIENNTLSTNAKNIKIITKDGVVTLRGVVNSQNEKNWIENRARAAGGIKRLDSQLEVKTIAN